MQLCLWNFIRDKITFVYDLSSAFIKLFELTGHTDWWKGNIYQVLTSYLHITIALLMMTYWNLKSTNQKEYYQIFESSHEQTS